MKWFDRWFYNKVRWAWDRAGKDHPEWKRQQDFLARISRLEDDYSDKLELSASSEVVVREESSYEYDGLRINISKLNGGFVVTFNHRGTTDQYGNYKEGVKSSHIITEDQDFHASLSKLITLEIIRN